MDVVHVALDARLTPAQVAEVNQAASMLPVLRVGAVPSGQSADVLVVPRLDQTALEGVAALAAAGAVRLVVASCALPGARQVLEALATGAADVRSGVPLRSILESVAGRAQRKAEVEGLLDSSLVLDNLAGRSAPWRSALRELILASRHSQAPILLLGETGTGKELLSRLVHTLDTRPAKGELVVVDCTTLTPELAGSELFGHERGAFTGATGSRRGAITAADRGTLFLDEIGELPFEVQAKLLRTLQEGTYKSVGGNQWQQARFRLLCATHRDLVAATEQGRFRADLYYRIAANVVRVPSLRERGGDIALLAERFAREFGCTEGLDEAVKQLLGAAQFPGNVRELRNLMQHAARAQGDAGPVSAGSLPRAWIEQRFDALRCGAQAMPLRSSLDEDTVIRSWLDSGLGLQQIAERAGGIAIRLARVMEGGHVGRAARRLGVTERALQKREKRRAPQAPA